MRVLYFHQHFVTPHGAGAIRSYAMARKLIERGHQVTMVCGSFTGCAVYVFAAGVFADAGQPSLGLLLTCTPFFTDKSQRRPG